MKAVLILSILVLTVASSYGLDCYDCIFYEGFSSEDHPHSDPDCEKNPKKIVTCDEHLTNLSSFGRNRTSASKGNGKANVYACYRLVGSSSSKKLVERDCAYVDESKINKCEKYQDYIDGELVNFEDCMCTTDKCNGSSTSSTVSGAGFMIISVFALIAANVSK